MRAALSDAEEIEYLTLLELERSDLARTDLNEYCRQIEIPGAPVNDDVECEEFYPERVQPAAHHRLVNETLMRVERGEILRLFIFQPPGTGKSFYASLAFPTWAMGRKRGRNIICASYSGPVATKFGRKCRQITRGPDYRRIFGCELVSDNRAADNWSLTNGSTYMAAGIMGGLTSNRADGGVIDDIVKGREQADSAAHSENTWEEFLSSFMTRLKPRAWVVYMGTRWSEKDPAGRILPKTWNGESGWVTARDGERWYVLCLPAECDRKDDPLGRKPGEFLWTEYRSVAEWEQIKRTQTGRNWSALYQQHPSPREGGIIKRDWTLKRWKPGPGEDARDFARRLRLSLLQSWDFPLDDTEGASYAAGTVWGFAYPDAYLLDLVHDRMNTPAMIAAVRLLSLRWPDATLKLIEKAAGGASVLSMLCRELPGLVPVKPEGSKESRMQATEMLWEAGNVWLPPDDLCPWVSDYIEEIVTFPASAFKDRADSTSQALNRLYMSGGASDEAVHATRPDPTPMRAAKLTSGKSWTPGGAR